MWDCKMYREKRYTLIFLTVLFHLLKEFQHFATSQVQLNRGEKSESVK